jgi:thioredoxin-related protein
MSKLKHTLFLSQAWGEVVAMLALYKKFRASEFQTKVLVSHEGDLSYVHGYLETKQWMKLYKIVTEHADQSLIYVWVSGNVHYNSRLLNLYIVLLLI